MMNQEIIGKCWHCGASLTKADYARENRCPGCGKGTHVCRNCRFLAPGKPNDCQESLVERVLDKDRPNFCDYFEPTAKPRTATVAAGAQDDLMRAAEDLFRK